MPALSDEILHIRIPARVMDDGRFSFFYGGPFPCLKPGAIVEVVVSDFDLESGFHRDVLTEGHRVAVVDAFAPILAMFGNSTPHVETAVKAIENESPVYPSARPKVEVTGVFMVPLEVLHLQVSVGKPMQLSSCQCWIPALRRVAGSLNEAYTWISQEYEPKRRSHTGNVFKKVYVSDSELKVWRRLEDLRMVASAAHENEMHKRCTPWWLGWLDRPSNGKWAYLDAPGDSTTRIWVMTGGGELVERMDLRTRDDAVMWLEGNGFRHLGTDVASKDVRPPEPPYVTPYGDEVRL